MSDTFSVPGTASAPDAFGASAPFAYPSSTIFDIPLLVTPPVILPPKVTLAVDLIFGLFNGETALDGGSFGPLTTTTATDGGLF